MAKRYIPDRQQDLAAWANNFAARISEEPYRYGLTPADAATIAGVCGDYTAALTAASDPATRATPAVAGKDSARAAMLGALRPYAQQIRGNLGVSNDDKAALGLNLPNAKRSAIPPPVTQPLMTLIGATPGSITARFADSNTPARRALPPGALALQVYVAIAAGAVSNPALAAFYAMLAKQPFAIDFGADDNGKTATVFARWINRKGELGPWSNPVSMTIVA
ncbi:MAG TPA: hypothetical protein VHS31_04265 [Tepidisphaeraceae bacterium]|nr:hypothetical protein [Tepidisphaeraceae bacterium]